MATGVGRQIAANRAAPLRGERKGEHEARVGGGLLDHCQGDASLDRERRIGRIDGAHAIQPHEREDDGVAPRIRRGAAALTRISTLWHDGHGEIGTGAHHRGYLFGAARTHDRGCLSMVAAAPIREERRHVGRIGEDLVASDGRVEPRPQDCANVHHDRR